MKSIKTHCWYYVLTVFVIMGNFSPPVVAETVKGILIPRAVGSHRNKLILNGTAIRSKWGFNVYVVALYLTEKSRDADVIMLNREPKRVHITMLHGVSEHRFVSTIEKNIDVNFSTEEKSRFATEIKAFFACFGGGASLEKFSTIDIDYVPGKGMHVTVDGRELEMIPGDDFYHAILRLWIGQPPQATLKTGLVGTDD